MRMLGVLLLILLVLPGCSVPSTVTDRFEIEPAQYDATFDATRDVLRHYRFNLARIDARSGVISTDAKTTAGLATPWDLEQSTVEDELSDFGNDQRRRVRVTFVPARSAEEPSDAGDPVLDMRQVDEPIEVLVQVYVERVRSPGWRLESTKINLTSRTADPTLRERGMQPTYVQTLHRDDAFARRVSYAIQQRLE